MINNNARGRIDVAVRHRHFQLKRWLRVSTAGNAAVYTWNEVALSARMEGRKIDRAKQKRRES